MKKIYICSICGKFQSENITEMIDHEETCGKENLFICHKCGKEIKWNSNDINAFETKNQCHHINLGRMGYGSILDGSLIDIQVCDSCLEEWISTFKFKGDIYNSGSNVCYSYDIEEESLSQEIIEE